MDLKDTLQGGIAAHQAGDLDRAEAAYRAVLTADPTEPDALHFAGLLSHQRGHTDLALSLIRDSLKLRPANAGAQNNLGNILRALDRREDALKAYQAAIGIDPDLADTWNNVGVLLRAADRMEEAASVLAEAVRRAPGHAEAWHNLGLTHLLRGSLEEAANAFEACLDLGNRLWSDPVWHARVLCKLGRHARAEAHLEAHLARNPDDPVVPHQLAALRGEDVARASDGYVREHFDQFAESFDDVLRALDYRAPEIVAARVTALAETRGGFADCADLGCGTGLCGPLIRGHVQQLIGVDLSPGMLRRAHTLGCYDFLVEGELTAFLDEAPRGAFGLAVSVDTLCYFGALDPVLGALTGALAPGGVLVATVERQEPGATDIALTESGRYTHSAAHIRSAAAAAGLDCLAIEDVVLRRELGQDVAGHVFTLARPGA